MNTGHPITVQKAQEQVDQSTQAFSSALNLFKGKVEESVFGVERYVKAAKNPVVMVSIVFTVGVFFGQLIRFSFKHRA